MKGAQGMDPTARAAEIKAWCRKHFGAIRFLEGDRRIHGRSSVQMFKTGSDSFLLKTFQHRARWEREVHGYEQWSQALEGWTPRLLAVRDQEPFAVVVTVLPGRPLREPPMGRDGEADVWRQAGACLASLHSCKQGTFFGPCRRDGSPQQEAVADPVQFVSLRLARAIDKAVAHQYIDGKEQALLRRAMQYTDVFRNSPPAPCHLDFGPDNWLVNTGGQLSGIIDFEFSQWDLWVNDFSRYPSWEWLQRPHLLQALYQGYGRSWSQEDILQCFLLRLQYGLDAVVWGMEAEFYGFVAEGHHALEHCQRGTMPDFPHWALP